MNINCKGKLIDLSTPKVMGILNVTPDSFFDGGKYKDEIWYFKSSGNHAEPWSYFYRYWWLQF